MPLLAVAVVLLDITLVVHAVRTGRPTFWIFVIFAFPLLGAVVYFLAELLPEMLGSRTARRARRDVLQRIDPDREYRALVEALERADTVDNRRALAAELVRRDEAADAVKLYESALVGVHEHDPALLFGLAQAEFARSSWQAAVDALERLTEHNPRYRSPDAHLLYARALEMLGRQGEALAEYQAVSRYFPGEEARARHAMLLKQLGRDDEARSLLDGIVRSVERGSRAYARAQREWIDLAKQNLGEEAPG